MSSSVPSPGVRPPEPPVGAGAGNANPLQRSVISALENIPVIVTAAIATGPGTQHKECKLIQGPTAIAAQLCLLVVVITALTIKRHHERPRRAWNVWLLDISKQACSGLAGHCVGMGVAIVAHRSSGHASQCGWYFVVYFADCTIGLTLALLFHKITNAVAKHFSLLRGSTILRQDSGGELRDHGHPWWEALVEIGNYGDPPNCKRWSVQVAFWVMCVVSARLIVGVVIMSCIPVLRDVTGRMDVRFAGHADMYLFTVMVGIPLVINCGQAWVQDQVLRFRRKHSVGPAKRGTDEDMPLALGGGGGAGGLGGGLQVIVEAGVSSISGSQRARAGTTNERTPTSMVPSKRDPISDQQLRL